MAGYTYENLAAGAEALRRAAIKTACEQAAIPPLPEAQSGQQKQDVITIEAGFAGVPAMFYPFLDMPRPESFDGIIDDLRNSALVLMTTQNSPDPALGLHAPNNNKFSAVTTVGDNLASWSGAAAREFKSQYLDKLPPQQAGQFNVVVTCLKLIEQEKNIWAEARKNVADVVNQAIAVLEDMPRRCSKNSWTVAFTVVAAVAGVAAAPLAAAGAGIAVGLAVTDKVAGGASLFVKDDPPENRRFGASTADGVIREVDRGLKELIARIIEQEGKIATVFTGANSVVLDERDSFVPKRPLLAKATPENVTDQDMLGFSS
ncbi:hypothetical protein [Plantactinospora endophytica]|uniref:Uncharacterized protein n=1 Tax=Plantactinospora endophytica TaxID=673535 RepID=A0ABQ4DU41_9ACTN|nr:hypothetical protein [Plantactinospora endophytica]GIG85652.1 hypothetical protein Pen02_05880 [Plantactinospora endophytica]